jgi:NAD(P)-dependent dehydrogenase (short-subunit alcohol dehydrogenase family)
LPCGFYFNINGKKATIDGGEIEATGRVSHSLQVRFGVGYEHTKITDPGALSFAGVTTGSRIAGTPAWNVTLGGVYTRPITATLDGFVAADYSYTGNSISVLNSGFGATATLRRTYPLRVLSERRGSRARRQPPGVRASGVSCETRPGDGSRAVAPAGCRLCGPVPWRAARQALTCGDRRMQIKDNVFVVTGAASGLGAATARMIVERGGKVVLADVSQEAGNRVEAELGANARFVATDVTTDGSARAAFAAASGIGTLRGLVNCAGVGPAEKVIGRDGVHKLDSFARAISINLVGTFNMIRLAAEVMSAAEPDAAGERGVIVNTASVAAFDGQIGQAAYAASKGGVVSMTLPIARELARAGIRVMTIAPGIMETPMLLSMPVNVVDALGKMVPFPSRMGKPAEYAALVEHIFSNPYLNGEVIRLDGAIRMAAR